MPRIVPVTDINAPELNVYARLTEAQLARFSSEEGLFIAESPNVIRAALKAGYQPRSVLIWDKNLEDGKLEPVESLLPPDLPVYSAPVDVLEKLTGFALTRGILCAFSRRPLPKAEDILASARRVALFERVMNPANMGALFRSAAALNMDAVLLSPGCTDPLYRRSARVSMGGVFQIPWCYLGDSPSDWPAEGVARLKAQGFKVAALALCDDSVSVDDPALMSEPKLAILLGTEGDGLVQNTIDLCDYTVKIPMSHGADSLNVAAAGAVAFWQLGQVKG